jgi:hypothetical protein
MGFGGSGGGGGGSVGNSTDVALNNPANNQVLSYDSAISKWKNGVVPANAADTVNLTGTQTVTGTKTFSAAPVVPDASFAIAKIANLQAQLNTAPVVVKWVNGTGWGSYSTDAGRVRYFHSQNDVNASAPTYYSTYDLWFRHPEAT